MNIIVIQYYFCYKSQKYTYRHKYGPFFFVSHKYIPYHKVMHALGKQLNVLRYFRKRKKNVLRELNIIKLDFDSIVKITLKILILQIEFHHKDHKNHRF